MVYLEILIATSFILFLLSSLVSGINEIWALLLNKRGRELRRALRLAFPELDDELMRRLYDHPLISPLKEKPKWDSVRGLFLKIINIFKTKRFNHDFLPSYIDSKLFSKALSDVLVLGAGLNVSNSQFNDWDRQLLATLDSLDETNFEFFKEIYIDKGVNSEKIRHIWSTLKDVRGTDFLNAKQELIKDLRNDFKSKSLIDKEQKEAVLLDKYLLHSGTETPSTTDFLTRNSEDLDSWLNNTSEWFENYMDRVSGWYKKRSHTNIFWWSLVLVVFLNINILELVSDFYKNQTLRDFWVENATNFTENPEIADKIEESLEPLKSIFSFRVPKLDEILKNLLGWLASVFAISLGAPFWFDMLGKAVNLRAAGKSAPKGRAD